MAIMLEALSMSQVINDCLFDKLVLVLYVIEAVTIEEKSIQTVHEIKCRLTNASG